MRELKILVFPGGTENALEIKRSLGQLKEIILFSASSDTVNHADFVYKNNFKISDVRSSEKWIDELNKITEEFDIKYIYPANSIIIDYLNKYRQKIKAKIFLPNENIINITRSKKETLKLLENIIPVPKIYSSLSEISYYPVFVKPDKGYGSQGTQLISSQKYLEQIDLNNFVIQEYLAGKEYTIDCFSNYKGEVLFAQGRTRERIRMGTSMHSKIANDELQKTFFEYALKIQEKISIQGAWFFQMKEDSNGELKLLEIDIRIAGTMALNRVLGINFPLLTVFDFLGYDVDLLSHNYKVEIDRSLKNRYKHDINYETVYVDLDDSLIVNNQLNLDLVKFLYQCVNTNKKIILLSKSLESDQNAYLKKWKIYDIFDEIYWLEENQSKADFIKSSNAIFIDDSFSQRKEVYERHKIHTFDNSMIEVLFDDRT